MTSPDSSGPKISSLADLLAVAYQIEADAVDRYVMLADQMEVHNNLDLVAAFRDLARAEAIHRDEIQRTAGDIDVVAHARNVAKWNKGESPEAVDLGSAHYLMTPWHALQLALDGEKRALAFFTTIAETAEDPAIRKMAAEFVEEEAEHVNLVNRLLLKHPKPDASWSNDLDPPNSPD
jgi:rubrerythrin